VETPDHLVGIPRVTRAARAVHRRWLRIAVGAALIAVPLIASLGAREALLANHPAYPISLLVALIVGVVMVVTGLRSLTPPRPGPMVRIERWAAAIGGFAIAGTLLWLQPAVATPPALAALASDDAVRVVDSRTQTVYEPAEPVKAGLVLYPGAKVDPRAYAVIARGIAEGGYRVVVPKCAFDIALTCENAARSQLTSDLPWAVGGHSLGGVAASSFAASNDVDGLVLLASYPVSDLSGIDGMAVLSISGTKDGLSSPAEVAERKPLLPPDTRYVAIEGAIHSHFGDYGTQSGDGTPTITREEAQLRIIKETQQFLAELGTNDEG
jgi:pimeloyl-ACP methyl ester carboxylesterase